MNTRIATAVRLFAIAIAIAGAIDPAVTSMRTGKPRVALIVEDSAANAALADRVASELRTHFTVVRAPIGGAAASVIVGDRLPTATPELTSPIFAVIPTRDGPTVTLDAVDAVTRAPVSARVPVTTVVHVTGAKGRKLDVALSVDSLTVDQVQATLTSDDTSFSVPLTFVPTALGAVSLHVAATVAGAQRAATADLVTEVRDTRWAVLFFDPRPSWMSTFVRRAIERDPRFVVTSRVVTSRGISTDAGQPPETFDDAAALGLFDAVVVGAPEALTDRQVGGLEDFMRRRGAGVVLLMDQQADGPYRRLTDVDRWENTSDDSTVRIAPVANDSGVLRAGEIAWPTHLPRGASTIALSRPGGKGSTATGSSAASGAPVVWRSAVGAGQLVVSGALDAWRYRDDSTAAFDAFWRALIAGSASAALPPIDIRMDQAILAPGETTGITVILRDATLADRSAGAIHAELGATIDGATINGATINGATPAGLAPALAVRLWPDGPIGTFRGTVRAPELLGVHRLIVSSGAAHADAPLVVAPAVTRPALDDRRLLAAWSVAHGGIAVQGAQLGDLPATLARTLTPQPHLETWYPMRSVWWLLLFVAALAYEWWWRRRRGLP